MVDVSTICQFPPRGDIERFPELRQFLRGAGDPDRLLEPEQLVMRLKVLDELDAVMGGLDPGVLTTASDRELIARARAFGFACEAANEILYEAARAEIVRQGNSPTLSRWLTGSTERPRPGQSFDLLDEIVSGVLQLRGPRETVLLPSPDMTAYQPTPARHILELIAACRISNDDILVDLGSGLGHVPLLVCILRGIRTTGVEVQPDHAASAQEAAQRLNLSHVRFVAKDARAADLSGATVFYMFTPFTGSILRDVVHRLQDESRRRQIRICALGPCIRMLQSQAWLIPKQPPDPERIAIFESR